MDSSRTERTDAPIQWVPWQIDRLRARVAHYRLSTKHSWERIATDILFVESLPESYVDNEDTRPLSESLRRLASQSQIPNLDRLNAIAAFLIEKDQLLRRDLVERDTGISAALAFNEFAYGDGSLKPQSDDLRFSIVGSFENASRHDQDNSETRRTLKCNFSGGVLSVSFDIAEYNNPGFQINLDANPQIRKRALRGASEYVGWAAVTPSGQATIFLRKSDYYDHQQVFLLAGIEMRAANRGTKSLLILESENVKGSVEISGDHLADQLKVFTNTKSRVEVKTIDTGPL